MLNYTAHTYVADGGDTVEAKRVLEFYSKSRLDKLALIEIGNSRLTQDFDRRSDLLRQRQVDFLGPDENNPQNRAIAVRNF